TALFRRRRIAKRGGKLSRTFHRVVAVLVGIAIGVLGVAIWAAADDEHARVEHVTGQERADEMHVLHAESEPGAQAGSATDAQATPAPAAGQADEHRPCDGCVGRADGREPPGQVDGPSPRPDNGYECDGNNGVGAGNPAHSACEPITPPPVPDTPDDATTAD